jgi:hypothetical protein
MTQPMQPTAASDHARHDPALIAALADREPALEARESALANELVARCDQCRDLFADLVAIRDAMPASATPVRPRSFTLTEGDARRLRSGWRRFVGYFGSARDAISRPLAIGFTTIGIVALVVTASPFQLAFGGASTAGPVVLSTIGAAVPGGAAGGAGGAAQPAASAGPAEPSRELIGLQASGAPSAAASSAPASTAGPSAAAASQDTGRAATEPYATGGETGVFTGSNDTDNESPDIDADQQATKSTDTTFGADRGLSLGLIVGGSCLIVGLGLFALRWSSRRLTA